MLFQISFASGWTRHRLTISTKTNKQSKNPVVAAAGFLRLCVLVLNIHNHFMFIL